MQKTVTAINWEDGIALLSSSETVPITNFLDSDGELCSKEYAVVAVAGSDEIGYFVIYLSDFIKIRSC